MRDNVRDFVRTAAQTFAFPDPMLEIGSRPADGQESIANLRSFFPDKTYIGSDFQGGSGVDVRTDAHLLGLRDNSLGSVVTMDTLEHLQDPVLVLREIHRILRPEGLLLLGVPMNFRIHNHPWDYWRYTPAALDLLVRQFEVRAVLYQGDPLFPHTVFALAQKVASPAEEVAFESSLTTLQSLWVEKEMHQAPLIRFEPLRESVVRDRDNTTEPRTLAELVEGSSVEQTFVCTSNDLTRIDLKFDTHGRMNNCHVSFRLHDETSGRRAAEGEYFAAHMVSQQWVPFQFLPIADSAGHLYRLTLTSRDGRPGSAVSPLLSDDEAIDGERLMENGQPASASLCFRALCRTSDYQPADYRALASPLSSDSISKESGQPVTPADDALRKVATLQIQHISYHFSRLNERLDCISDRLDALEQRQDDLLLFVRSLQTSAPARVLRRIGGLLRRG